MRIKKGAIHIYSCARGIIRSILGQQEVLLPFVKKLDLGRNVMNLNGRKKVLVCMAAINGWLKQWKFYCLVVLEVRS